MDSLREKVNGLKSLLQGCKKNQIRNKCDINNRNINLQINLKVVG